MVCTTVAGAVAAGTAINSLRLAGVGRRELTRDLNLSKESGKVEVGVRGNLRGSLHLCSTALGVGSGVAERQRAVVQVCYARRAKRSHSAVNGRFVGCWQRSQAKNQLVGCLL